MDQDSSPPSEEPKELTASEKAALLPDPEGMVIDDAADDLIKAAEERLKGQPDPKECAVDALVVAAARAAGRAGGDFGECFRLFSEVYKEGVKEGEAAAEVALDDEEGYLFEVDGGGMVN